MKITLFLILIFINLIFAQKPSETASKHASSMNKALIQKDIEAFSKEAFWDPQIPTAQSNPFKLRIRERKWVFLHGETQEEIEIKKFFQLLDLEDEYSCYSLDEDIPANHQKKSPFNVSSLVIGNSVGLVLRAMRIYKPSFFQILSMLKFFIAQRKTKPFNNPHFLSDWHIGLLLKESEKALPERLARNCFINVLKAFPQDLGVQKLFFDFFTWHSEKLTENFSLSNPDLLQKLLKEELTPFYLNFALHLKRLQRIASYKSPTLGMSKKLRQKAVFFQRRGLLKCSLLDLIPTFKLIIFGKKTANCNQDFYIYSLLQLNQIDEEEFGLKYLGEILARPLEFPCCVNALFAVPKLRNSPIMADEDKLAKLVPLLNANQCQRIGLSIATAQDVAFLANILSFAVSKDQISPLIYAIKQRQDHHLLASKTNDEFDAVDLFDFLVPLIEGNEMKYAPELKDFILQEIENARKEVEERIAFFNSRKNFIFYTGDDSMEMYSAAEAQ